MNIKTSQIHLKLERKRNPQKKPKKVQKIVKGEARTKKRSGVMKLADIFLPEDVDSIKKHVIYDVIIPAAKKIISDTVDTYLYGENSSNFKKIHRRGYHMKIVL